MTQHRRRDFLRLSAGVAALTGFAAKAALADTVVKRPKTIFDAHAHLVSDDQMRYPRVPATAPSPFSGSLPAGVSGQPSARFPYVPRAEPDVERVVQWMDEYQIDGIAAVQKRGTYGFDNSYILDSAARYPKRFSPVVVLDATDPATPDTLRALIRDRNLAGLRLTGGPAPDGSFPWLNSPAALRCWAVADADGLVMDLMVSAQPRSEAAIAAIVDLAKTYPNVRLVLDHAAFPNPQGAPDYGIDAVHSTLAGSGNIYVKITTINLDVLRESNITVEGFVRRVVDVFGADRVMWGSDLGNSSGDYAEMIDRMVEATALLSVDERRAVMHDTGRRVFVGGGTRQRTS